MTKPVCPRCLNVKPGISAGDPDKPHPGPFTREVCSVCAFTTDEKTEISRAFSRGNFANAYESTDLDDFDLDEMSEHERAAFVLGFFGSYSLDEIISDREIFDECYWSPAGQYVVNVARYTDSREDEYREESDGAL